VGGVFFIPVKRPYVQLSSPGRQKGSRVDLRKGWVVCEVWVDGGMGGFKEWVDGWVS